MPEMTLFPVMPRHDLGWHVQAATKLAIPIAQAITLEDLTKFAPGTLYQALQAFLDSKDLTLSDVAIACDRLKVAAPLADHSDVTLYALDRYDRDYRRVQAARWVQNQSVKLPEEGNILFITDSGEPEPLERQLAYADEIRACRRRLMTLYPKIHVEEFDLETNLDSKNPDERAQQLSEIIQTRDITAVFCANFFLTTSRTLAGLSANIVGVEISYHEYIVDLAAGYNYAAPHLVRIDKGFLTKRCK
jgi:hypothetical protein